jgi:hypothetical protein
MNFNPPEKSDCKDTVSFYSNPNKNEKIFFSNTLKNTKTKALNSTTKSFNEL